MRLRGAQKLDRFIERSSAFLGPNPCVARENQNVAGHPATQFLDESRVEGRILPREIHFANHRARRGVAGIGRFFARESRLNNEQKKRENREE